MIKINTHLPDGLIVVLLSSDSSIISRLKSETARSGLLLKYFSGISDLVEWEKTNNRDIRICLVDSGSAGISFPDALRTFEQNSLSIDVILLLDRKSRMSIRDLKRYGVHDAFFREDLFSSAIAGKLGNSVVRLLDERKSGFPCEGNGKILSLYDTISQPASMLLKINHQLRNPLGGITGMAKMLERTPLDPEQKDYIKGILLSAGKLEAIIGQITENSGAGNSESRLYCCSFNPRSLVSEVLSFYTKGEYLNEEDFRTEFAGNLPEVITADKARLEQILNNLVDCAIKRKGNSEINLGVSHLSGNDKTEYLKFKISGEGGERSAIDHNMKDLAKQLVTRIGGEVTFNVEDGGFFLIDVSFPLCDVPGLSKTCLDVRGDYPAKKLRLLIVEDELINQTYMKRLLESFGWEADTACNGRQALDLFEQGKYDLIIMDGQMPGMDGFEASRRIRDIEGNACKTPIIAISGYALTEYDDRFKEAGIDDFLSKPVDETVLIKLVKKITARS